MSMEQRKIEETGKEGPAAMPLGAPSLAYGVAEHRTRYFAVRRQSGRVLCWTPGCHVGDYEEIWRRVVWQFSAASKQCEY
jgi:hypothetical protein